MNSKGKELISAKIKQAQLSKEELIKKQLDHSVYSCSTLDRKFCFFCLEFAREETIISILNDLLDNF